MGIQPAKSVCSIFDVFLAFLSGVGLLLLVVTEVFCKALIAIGLAASSPIISFVNLIMAIIGLLAVLLFAFCIFRKACRCCFGRKC